MFSVYGQAGRLFRGSMEELRKVGPTSGLARAQRVHAVGRDAQDENPPRFAELVPRIPVDVAHRSAVAAYAQTTKIDAPRHPLTKVDAIIRKTTLESFGPVRSVRPTLVFELGFEGIAHSPRHKSGIAVRFPRMLRWREDKPVGDADTLQTLAALLPNPSPGA